MIGISVRELQNWEAVRYHIRIETLHDLAEITGIPMQVCVALNAEQPLWYSLRRRRFAYSSVEEALFSSYELLRHHKQSDNEVITNNYPIKTDKHLSLILSCHDDIYGVKIPLGREAIEAASIILPDFNRIVFDSWGHYVGHQVCFPLKHELYQQLKKLKNFESLTANAMNDIVAQKEGVFYVHSFFMANISVAHSIINHNCRFLAKIEPKEKYLAARVDVTVEGKDIPENFGLKMVFGNATEQDYMQTEIVPAIHEIKLAALMRKAGRISWSSKMW